MKQIFKNFWRNNKVTLLIILVVAAVYVSLMVLGQRTCPSASIFGITCPGCGMTRAFASVFRLDLKLAFYYNPLWPLVIVTFITEAVLWLFDKRRAMETLGIVFGAVAFAVYFVRLFMGHPVVVWNFEAGLIYKVYEWLVNLF